MSSATMSDFGMQDVYTLQIKRHRRSNDIISPNCEACQKGFLHVNSLQVREFTQTGKLPGVCKSCNTSFLKICRIQIRNMTQNEAHSHVCEICGKSFTHAGNYMKHKRLHTSLDEQSLGGVAAITSNTTTSVSQTRPSPPHTCDKCGKLFMKYGSYLNHLEGHNIHETLVCPICDRTCSTRATFKTHVERCKKRQAIYVCQYCENTFGTKSSLKEHLETHVVVAETNVCKFCKESFHVAEELEQHLLQHLSEHSKVEVKEEGKPSCADEKEKFNHFCVECKKGFVHLGTLRNHMRSHSSKLPFQCKTCKKQFVHSGRLKKHMKLHTRKWPYSCTVCTKRFINLKCFNKHKASHKE